MKRMLFAIGIAVMIVVAGSAALLGLGAFATHDHAATMVPVWTETRWPFLRDPWGVGKAYVCKPADCGVRIEVFIRPKIGFCNCTTGVSDETDLERVADTDLVSATVRPIGPASPVTVGWMHGLSRTYQMSADKPDQRLLSVAFNNACDVVVALAALGEADPAAMTPAVIAFLNSPSVLEWTRKELGL
jgi:hypothetical protein